MFDAFGDTPLANNFYDRALSAAWGGLDAVCEVRELATSTSAGLWRDLESVDGVA